MFKKLPENSADVGVVKLDTSLANNGFVAYQKGFEAGHRICASSNRDRSDHFSNTELFHKNQLHFT